MKLIIDIPDDEYELIVNDEACGLHPLTRAVAHGIPFDGFIKMRCEDYVIYNIDHLVKNLDMEVDMLKKSYEWRMNGGKEHAQKVLEEIEKVKQSLSDGLQRISDERYRM